MHVYRYSEQLYHAAHCLSYYVRDIFLEGATRFTGLLYISLWRLQHRTNVEGSSIIFLSTSNLHASIPVLHHTNYDNCETYLIFS